MKSNQLRQSTLAKSQPKGPRPGLTWARLSAFSEWRSSTLKDPAKIACNKHILAHWSSWRPAYGSNFVARRRAFANSKFKDIIVHRAFLNLLFFLVLHFNRFTKLQYGLLN
ncbi:hypothetical protein BT63DRAFT_229811 [Microthyrium microscopicum]|uniref:Uncharacterized protein n=1 Tax=Microthyrium microscopicum TaxID=703497 RepID=A0A6A6UF93_9PEZI|nr:hypothetical protein BT63DRAFT_229811 [Microthyrium microscopicum]